MRRRKRQRAYQDVLDSIARLEYELGFTDVSPRRGRLRTPEDAARKWTAAKAANYAVGFAAGVARVDPKL